jgi:hypothetical protein
MPMITRTSLRLAVIAITTLAAILILNAWRADRRDRAQLSTDLATANQALAQAAARQHARDAQLQQALAAIAAQKLLATKPAQILHQLPKTIPLPSPIRLQTQTAIPNIPTAPCSSGVPSCGTPEALNSTQPSRSFAGNATFGKRATPAQQVVLPSADLKPLYDFALDCQACQAKLAAAQADLADERGKTVALARERDDAVRIAKGGSILRRAERATKWFLIGAAAGAIAATAHH